MSDLAAVASLADVPEGAVPVCAVTVVSYLDEDGDGAVTWHISGDPDLVTVTGLLTMAAHNISHSVDDDD